MTIDYAKAYARERVARAETRRMQREATAGHRAAMTAGRPRPTIGQRLIGLGARLDRAHQTMSSPVTVLVRLSK